MAVTYSITYLIAISRLELFPLQENILHNLVTTYGLAKKEMSPTAQLSGDPELNLN